MTIDALFTVHTLRPFYVFSNVLDFIEAVCSIYQNVLYFIRSKKLYWILPQLDILCTSTWNDTMQKKWQFTVQRVTCFPLRWSSWKQEKLAIKSLDLNLVNSLLWRALQQELYRQDFRDIDRLKYILLHCWVWWVRRTIKETSDRLLKRVAMVFRV